MFNFFSSVNVRDFTRWFQEWYGKDIETEWGEALFKIIVNAESVFLFECHDKDGNLITAANERTAVDKVRVIFISSAFRNYSSARKRTLCLEYVKGYRHSCYWDGEANLMNVNYTIINCLMGGSSYVKACMEWAAVTLFSSVGSMKELDENLPPTPEEIAGPRPQSPVIPETSGQPGPSQPTAVEDASLTLPEMQTESPIEMVNEAMDLFDRGTPQDIKAGVVLFRRAAEQGYASGQYGLGVCYLMGRGLPQDEELAELWIRKAKRQGFIYAQHTLPVIRVLEARKLIDANGPLGQDVKLGLSLMRQEAEAGNGVAQYQLAFLYQNPETASAELPQDEEMANLWFRKARKILETSAFEDSVQHISLAILQLNGWGGAVDTVSAISHLEQAAEQGAEEAAYMLGLIYRDGKGVEKNPQKAVEWFSKMPDSPLLQVAMAQCYEEGIGVSPDKQAALLLYRKAADVGYPAAEEALRRFVESSS